MTTTSGGTNPILPLDSVSFDYGAYQLIVASSNGTNALSQWNVVDNTNTFTGSLTGTAGSGSLTGTPRRAQHATTALRSDRDRVITACGPGPLLLGAHWPAGRLVAPVLLAIASSGMSSAAHAPSARVVPNAAAPSKSPRL